MRIETGLIYSNKFGDEVEIVEDKDKDDQWSLLIKLHNGNRNNYKVPIFEGIMGNNYLDCTVHCDNEITYVTFNIFASDDCWHGTILMKALFEKIDNYEKANNLKIHHVMGKLSTADKDNNWTTSIPFYLSIPKRMKDADANKRSVKAHIHLIDDTNKRKGIGPIVDNIQDFINGNQDGYIVYHI